MKKYIVGLTTSNKRENTELVYVRDSGFLSSQINFELKNYEGRNSRAFKQLSNNISDLKTNMIQADMILNNFEEEGSSYIKGLDFCIKKLPWTKEDYLKGLSYNSSGDLISIQSIILGDNNLSLNNIEPVIKNESDYVNKTFKRYFDKGVSCINELINDKTSELATNLVRMIHHNNWLTPVKVNVIELMHDEITVNLVRQASCLSNKKTHNYLLKDILPEGKDLTIDYSELNKCVCGEKLVLLPEFINFNSPLNLGEEKLSNAVNHAIYRGNANCNAILRTINTIEILKSGYSHAMNLYSQPRMVKISHEGSDYLIVLEELSDDKIINHTCSEPCSMEYRLFKITEVN